MEARVQESARAASLDRSGLAEALGSLPRIEVPSELDRGVVQALEAAASEQGQPDESGESWEDSIGTLPRLSAPSVLDRLVAEEILNPAATAERFIGDLPRPSGQPAVLTFERETSHQNGNAPGRQDGNAPGSISGWLRRPALRAGVTLAAAAAVLVWLVPASFLLTDSPEDTGPVREFKTPFVWADQASDLDPAAQLLAEGLSGGRLNGASR